MITYDPITLAMPLSKVIGEFILENGRLPEGDELKGIMRRFGIEESCLDRGMMVYRTKFLVILVFRGRENVVIDIIPSTGELSDALEVIAYKDKKLGAVVVEIVPANDLEYEGNIGIEPIIIDERTLELESNPVLGHFEEDENGISLVIDRKTYERWKSRGDVQTCPICGGELAWEGEKAYCWDCGYGLRVKG